MEDFRKSITLYGVGSLFGIITILYFGFEYLIALSPLTKSLILFTIFTSLFALGTFLTNKLFSNISYVLSSAGYLAFFVYTVNKFGFTTDQIMASLFLSSLLFIGLGYTISEKKLEMDKKQLQIILGITAGIIALFLIVDVLGPSEEYEINFDEEITIEDVNDQILGTVTVTNQGLLPRDINWPNTQACTYNDTQRISMNYINADSSQNMVWGRNTVTENLTTRTHGLTNQGFRDNIDTGIEIGDTVTTRLVDECPEVYEGEELLIIEP